MAIANGNVYYALSVGEYVWYPSSSTPLCTALMTYVRAHKTRESAHVTNADNNVTEGCADSRMFPKRKSWLSSF